MSRTIDALAAMVVHTRWDELPAAVQRLARLVLLDTLGVILGGSEQPEVARLRAGLSAGAGSGATVLARGWAIKSASEPRYWGRPRRTGLRKMSSPSSTMPGMMQLPPVKTTPEDKTSSKPDSRITWFTSVKISSTRGSITPARAWRLSMRGLRSPRPGTSTCTSGFTNTCLA